MKTLNEFIDKLESGSTYLMFRFDRKDGSRECRQEIIKDPYRVKAAKIIKTMSETIGYYSRMGGLPSEQAAIACFSKISKILNEEEK